MWTYTERPSHVRKAPGRGALTRGLFDTVTMVVAFLQPVSTSECIYADRWQKYAAHQMFLTAKCSMSVFRAEQRSADEL